jgi:hypothetical protein
MPRIAKGLSGEIASLFAPWIADVFKRLKTTPSAVAYATRRAKKIDPLAIEISHSTLTRYLDGTSAPTVDTVRLLVQTLAPMGPLAPSTPSALFHSYPHVVLQIVQGLDAIGLDTYRAIFRRLPQEARRRQRSKLQRALAAIGNTLINNLPRHSSGSFRTADVRKADPHFSALHKWLRRVFKHRDLFAVVVAYDRFGSYFGNDETTAFSSLLDFYSPDLEAIYIEALHRYPTFDHKNEHYFGPEMLAAENLLAEPRIGIRSRIRAVSALLQPWAWEIAGDFLLGIPMIPWVEEDTLRENLG